jgi:hypothetical protein
MPCTFLTFLQVINSMGSWRNSSRFAAYIESNPSFFLLQSPQGTAMSFDDDGSLVQATNALYRLSARTPSVHPLAQRVHEIFHFAQDFQSCSNSMQSKGLFEKLKPLREWLFWMPVTIVQANDMSSSAMILLAQTYALALAIDFALPELSGAALGSLTASSIQQIDKKLRYKLDTGILSMEMQPSDYEDLMQSARLVVAQNNLVTPSLTLIKLEDIAAQGMGIQSLPIHSPYGHSHHRPLSVHSIGSQPGTPDYPPPGTPGFSHTPPMVTNLSFEDLSHPPSPFLRYDSPVSPRHSLLGEPSPRPHSLSFDNRSLTGYEYSLKGDSPAYSPAAYSPGLLPEPNDEEWAFPEPSPLYPTGFVSQKRWNVNARI